jgi:hypothetical protein
VCVLSAVQRATELYICLLTILVIVYVGPIGCPISPPSPQLLDDALVAVVAGIKGGFKSFMLQRCL